MEEEAEAVAATFGRDGVAMLRGALDKETAAAARRFVEKTLEASLARVDSRQATDGDLFGATAPPDKGYSIGGGNFHGSANRWNVLLPIDDDSGGGGGDATGAGAAAGEGAPNPVRRALAQMLRSGAPTREVLDRVFGARVRDRAVLCDLSALVAGVGTSDQRLHFDTRHSDSEESDGGGGGGGEGEGGGGACAGERGEGRRPAAARRPRRLVQVFVALQDVSHEMAPTLMVARTNTARAHDAVHEALGKEQDAVLAAFERGGMRCAPMAAGDLVFMDSRTLHKGTANASGRVRAMLDFAFVDPLHIPGTYCGCVLEELGERQLRLSDADVWAA